MVLLEQVKLGDFVLLLLFGIKRRHRQDCLAGRTMAQKVVFLVTRNTRLRKSCGVNYRLHYYGPYSSEVREAFEYLTTFGLVEETPREMLDFTRYDFRLSRQGEQRAEMLYNMLDRASKVRIDGMVDEAAKLNAMPLQKVIRKAYAQAKIEKLI